MPKGAGGSEVSRMLWISVQYLDIVLSPIPDPGGWRTRRGLVDADLKPCGDVTLIRYVDQPCVLEVEVQSVPSNRILREV